MKLLLLWMGLAGCVTVGTSPVQVERLGGMPGPEDLVWDAERAQMLVSSTDRREETAPGQIYGVRGDQVVALKRVGEPDGLDFNPHGVDLWKGRLFVVNHTKEGAHSVLIYAVADEGLSLLEELRSPLLTSPNDLVVADDGTLYVSNDRSEGGGLNEIIFRQKKASVVMYRDGVWSVAVDALAMPNGLEVDGGHLYVAITREDGIFAWDRAADGGLSNRRLIAAVKSPDNLSWHRGDLVVACHLSDWAFLRHARAGADAPSWIARIGLNGEVTTVFEDPGAKISGVSTAVSVGSTWWLGQVFEPFVGRIRR